MDEKDKLFRFIRYAIIIVVLLIVLRFVFGVVLFNSVTSSDNPSWITDVKLESLLPPK